MAYPIEIDGLEKTKNNFGWMHNKSVIMDEFVKFSLSAKFPMLDVGAAYGIATIPCLKNGAKIIACDISAEHLQILSERTPENLRQNLTTVAAKFPNEIDFPENSMHGVLFSHVLSFLEVEEFEYGIKWPGFLEDKRIYATEAGTSSQLPYRLHFLDIPILRKIAEENKFHIEMLDYVGGEHNGVPKKFCLDGREWVGMIARK